MAGEFGDVGGGGPQTIKEFESKMAEAFSLKLDDFSAALTRLTQGAVEVNKVFGQGRQRIVEIQQGIADAIPLVNRLGGNFNDVQQIMKDVAEATKRNYLASAENVEQLYAAEKTLGLGAKELVNAYSDVGMNITHVGETLNKSVQYIQSIGGNARDVMKSVVANMDQLNRYQFEGGVEGLAKMAAKAAMLRTDMSVTFGFADKLFNPERAIEVASAFQRLGVAAGNLVDPFALMNASINDPGALQDSLANVAKQFTYFDEKTKSFKISPQGVLTLREMEDQAGLAAGSLSKMGLAAADLDKRLAAVSSTGFKFATEEDKQLIASIAQIGSKGEYTVKVKDDKTGNLITKELSQVTENEFQKLIKEQKEGPKTLEEFARSQMSLTEVLTGDVTAIRNKIVGGVASATPLAQGVESARTLVESIAGEVSKVGMTGDVRGKVDQFIGGAENMLKEMKDPNANKFDTLAKYLDKMGTEIKGVETNVMQKLKEAAQRGLEKARRDEGINNLVSKYMSSPLQTSTQQRITGQLTTQQQSRGSAIQEEIKKIAESYNIQANTKIEMGGKITIDINGNQTFTEEQKNQITKAITDKLGEIGTQNMVVGLQNSQNQDPTKSSGVMLKTK